MLQPPFVWAISVVVAMTARCCGVTLVGLHHWRLHPTRAWRFEQDIQGRLEESSFRLEATEQLCNVEHQLGDRLRALLGVWVRSWTPL